MNRLNTGTRQAIVKYSSVSVQTEVENASPYRLVQMLLNGALARISMARIAIGEGDPARKGEYISSAISIIGGLRDSLDHKAGGTVASNLEKLYAYMTDKLLEANIKNDSSILNEVNELLLGIKTSWDEIGNLPEAINPHQTLDVQQRKTG